MNYDRKRYEVVVDSIYGHSRCFMFDCVTISTDSIITSTHVNVNNLKVLYPLHVLLKSLNAVIHTVFIAFPSSLLLLLVTPLQLAGY